MSWILNIRNRIHVCVLKGRWTHVIECLVHYEGFYAPGSNDRGHIDFVLSVCLFECLSVVNFNLRYRQRSHIFHTRGEISRYSKAEDVQIYTCTYLSVPIRCTFLLTRIMLITIIQWIITNESIRYYKRVILIAFTKFRPVSVKCIFFVLVLSLSTNT